MIFVRVWGTGELLVFFGLWGPGDLHFESDALHTLRLGRSPMSRQSLRSDLLRGELVQNAEKVSHVQVDDYSWWSGWGRAE